MNSVFTTICLELILLKSRAKCLRVIPGTFEEFKIRFGIFFSLTFKMPMVALKKQGKLVMKWLPNDGVHLIDLDKDLTYYKEDPDPSLMSLMAKADLERLVLSSGFEGNTKKMKRIDLAEKCAEFWPKIVKAHALEVSAWALVGDDVSSPTLKKLNEQSIFTPFCCFIRVQGDTLFRFLTLEGFNIGSPIGGFEWVLKSGTSSAFPHDLICNWGGNFTTFDAVPVMSGGVAHPVLMNGLWRCIC